MFRNDTEILIQRNEYDKLTIEKWDEKCNRIYVFGDMQMVWRKCRYGIFAAVWIILIAIANCLSLPSGTIKAANGVVDLREIDFSQRQNYRLDGEWEFYWKQLLSYEDMQNFIPDLYAVIPDAWNNYTMNGESLPGQGYATYRLHVITDLPANTKSG